MHDHARIVGGLYLGWAAIQVVGVVVLSLVNAELQPRAGLVWVAWGLVLLLAVAFAIVGALLWRHDARARKPAIVLAIAALLSFPVGTAVGAYALWALLRRVHAAAGA